ncbi:MAG TPA: hypothetical protein PLM70_07545 [Bacteroidales bacterium]|nr:hypothetical protein [Bacteroidales bacterium]
MENTIKEKNEKELWGFVVYDIMDDGCLNGIWTNSYAQENQLMNEIARKEKISNDNIEIAGHYKLAWIEPNEKKPITGTLIITKKPDENTYLVEWRNGNKIAFYGKGLILGKKKLVVYYWEADKNSKN